MPENTAWGRLLLAALLCLAGASASAEIALPSPLALTLAAAGLAPLQGRVAGPDTGAPVPGADSAPAVGPVAAARGQARLRDRVRHTRAAGAAVIVGWGLLAWEYGDRPPHLESEGWFEAGTDEGGADKLGHLYTGYVLARTMAALYRSWGLATPMAAKEGALTSLLVTTVMEVGDGFSPYGSSGEDLVMNLAGAATGYALALHPAWRERVDLRVEYRFHGLSGDLTTDYEHARYLVALKPAGWRALDVAPLRWLEVQAGYFSRGYDDPRRADSRTTFAGIGLNLPLLARRAGLARTGAFLQFYQPPETALRREQRQ